MTRSDLTKCDLYDYILYYCLLFIQRLPASRWLENVKTNDVVKGLRFEDKDFPQGQGQVSPFRYLFPSSVMSSHYNPHTLFRFKTFFLFIFALIYYVTFLYLFNVIIFGAPDLWWWGALANLSIWFEHSEKWLTYWYISVSNIWYQKVSHSSLMHS